jgi:hypothetical protein
MLLTHTITQLGFSFFTHSIDSLRKHLEDPICTGKKDPFTVQSVG